jgi:hypothetical protein
LCRHVVLKGVNELMTEHVIGFGEAAGEGQDDAAFGALGDATGALADLAGQHIGLLEMRVRRIQDQRLAAAQLVLQQLGDSRVPPLRHARGEGHRSFFLRVVIDVEVLGGEHLEVKLFVLDLVAPEILRARRRGRDKRQHRRQQDRNTGSHTHLAGRRLQDPGLLDAGASALHGSAWEASQQ